MNPKVKLFIDASVFIAGAASETGGSAIILKLCQKSFYKAVTTELVLEEVRRNLKNKFEMDIVKKFYNTLSLLVLEVQPAPVTGEKYQKIIDSKDIHVLAAAIESKCDYLVTLDKKHFFTTEIQKAKLPIRIVTPKDLINELYR